MATTSSQAPKGKRKRDISTATTPSEEVINPLSHTPDTLKQFAVAGQAPEQPIPSSINPSFPHQSPSPHKPKPSHKPKPHRPFHYPSTPPIGIPLHQSSSSSASESSDNDEALETDYFSSTDAHGRYNPSRRANSATLSRREDGLVRDRLSQGYHRRVAPLIAIVQRLLVEGDISGAQRAFGLLHRARVYGRRVDLRVERYWELGTEILLRGGEGDGEEEGEGGEEREQRRMAGNRARVAAYYTALIQLHPWTRLHKSNISALDFYPALFSCEMESVHADHAWGVEKVERAARGEMEEEWDGDGEEEGMDEDAMDIDGGDDQLRIRWKKDRLRITALQRMRDLAARMDTAMDTMPFAQDHELLRLRGMVALYLADLCVPLVPRSEVERINGERAREKARAKARDAFAKIKDTGGRLEEQWLMDMLRGSDEEDDYEDDGGEPAMLQMYSSLPMR